ncbi:MAG: hydrogenase maturation nickel metallochaperone HypA [Gammaproteobacteria bacterium]|nr:hydrogenase maturation nickel metallochaperone HypA [Gammaproteobacteria bacterium]
MHELSICQALIDQVENLARENQAVAVKVINLQVGPLSGAEIPLLEHAWPLASAGTVAESAELFIEPMPVRVRCKTCGVESGASANRLLCGECGDYHTELISGDEMVLTRLEFDT